MTVAHGRHVTVMATLRSVSFKLLACCCALVLEPTLAHADAPGGQTAKPPRDSIAPVSPFYAWGSQPDVAFSEGGVVVEVRESGNDGLFYRIGKVLGPVILWGESRQYAVGREPAVALATAVGPDVVVEVHRAAGSLCCQVGAISSKGSPDAWRIDWQPAQVIAKDDGHSPALAVQGTTLVLVYSDAPCESLFYRVGFLETSDWTIQWLDSHPYDTGAVPDVAIHEHTVVEVHQSENRDTLWYHVGELAGSGLIFWNNSCRYDGGTHPSVALLGDGTVVETHTSENTDTLWAHVGTVNETTIDWQAPHRLATGLGGMFLPTSVAARDLPTDEATGPALAVVVQIQSSDGHSYVRDELGFVHDYVNAGDQQRRVQLTEERWMELYPHVRDLSLRQVRLIGSHDADSSDIDPDCPRCWGHNANSGSSTTRKPTSSDLKNARCQSGSILDQLRAGVRHLDLRVCFQYEEKFKHYAYFSEHIWRTASPMEDVLAQIRQFFSESPDEVIIIVTHREHIYSETTVNLDDKKLRGLATQTEMVNYFWTVKNLLGDLLVPAPTGGGDPFDVTLGEILAGPGRVIYIGPDQLGNEIQKYVWPDRIDSTWLDEADTQDELINQMTDDVVETWNRDGYQGQLRIMQAMTNDSNKITNAALTNPVILQSLCSIRSWRECSEIPVVMVNDAVNTPDWVRTFLLLWEGPYTSTFLPDLTGRLTRIGRPKRTVRARFECQNTGLLGARGFRIRFYFSHQSTLSTRAESFASASIRSLPAGDSVQIRIRGVPEPSEHYLVAVVDAAASVLEADESNNVIWCALPSRLGARPQTRHPARMPAITPP